MEPLNYLTTDIGRIWLIACIPLGVLLTAAAFWVINHVPAAWLCDYDETPSPELLSGKRVRFLPAGVLLSVVSILCLMLCRLQFNKGFDIYFLLLGLIILDCLMIAISDWKYQIIPDQFTVALGVLALGLSVYDLVRGFRILHMAWWSPLAGALMGAAAMLLIDFIGMIVYHREGMGFGDVKLFLAAGILTGFPGTIYTFLMAVLTATVCFVGIILFSRISASPEEETDGDTKETEAPASEEAQPQQERTGSEEPVSADTAPEEEKEQQNTETEPQEPEEAAPGLGSYLAFGPYIALGVVAYVVLFDTIQSLVQMYLNLF